MLAAARGAGGSGRGERREGCVEGGSWVRCRLLQGVEEAATDPCQEACLCVLIMGQVHDSCAHLTGHALFNSLFKLYASEKCAGLHAVSNRLHKAHNCAPHLSLNKTTIHRPFLLSVVFVFCLLFLLVFNLQR